jgi:hypothetical protein
LQEINIPELGMRKPHTSELTEPILKLTLKRPIFFLVADGTKNKEIGLLFEAVKTVFVLVEVSI